MIRRLADMIKRKGPAVPRVSLTFDDGPHPVYSSLIRDHLAAHQAQGTFFMTGSNLLRHREQAGEMARAGHEIGNHFFSHANPLFMTGKKCLDEVQKTKEIIEDITGVENRLVRPPFGIVTPWLVSACRRLGMTMVLWNVNSFDFRRKAHQTIARRVKAGIKPGCIILFHECHYVDASCDYKNTIQALGPVLAYIEEKKLKAVTVGHLLGTPKQGQTP
jgi:peptidoglycan/xylan/chitin deacetylase (PgdA/CDA1 family)